MLEPAMAQLPANGPVFVKYRGKDEKWNKWLNGACCRGPINNGQISLCG